MKTYCISPNLLFFRILKGKNIVLALLLSFFFYSCSSDDDAEEVIDPRIEAEVLPCDYFSDENRTLVHTPGAEIDYIVECVMTVEKDIVIEPGVRIAFELDAGLHIKENGNLTAVGTADEPILFTGTEKVRGFWKGVAFTSPGVRNKLEHVTIEYGGGAAIHANVKPANLTVSYDTRLSVDNSTFSNSQNFGMYVYSNTRELSVQNSTFTQNKVPVYSYNTPNLMEHMNGTNDYSGNDNDVVELSGGRAGYGFNSSLTWHKINVPYFLYHDITVTGSGTVLNVEPGVHVIVGQGKKFEPEAKVIFQGTAEDPIIFEGADPTPGYWEGFYVHGAINSEMDHMIIKHAGGGSNEAAVYIRYGTTISITNVHFEDIYGCAIKDRDSGSNNITTANITKTNTNTGNVNTLYCIE